VLNPISAPALPPDRATLGQLYQESQRLIRHVCRRYRNMGVAASAFLSACRTYDASRGPFNAYFPYVVSSALGRAVRASRRHAADSLDKPSDDCDGTAMDRVQDPGPTPDAYTAARRKVAELVPGVAAQPCAGDVIPIDRLRSDLHGEHFPRSTLTRCRFCEQVPGIHPQDATGHRSEIDGTEIEFHLRPLPRRQGRPSSVRMPPHSPCPSHGCLGCPRRPGRILIALR